MTRPRRALGQGSEVAQPDTLLGASGVAVLDRRMGPVARRSLAPGRACAPNVENAADHAAIGHPRHATRLVGQKRRDQGPLRLRHIAGIVPLKAPALWKLGSPQTTKGNPLNMGAELRTRSGSKLSLSIGGCRFM